MFSEREELVVKIIGKRKLTIKDIAAKFFVHYERPFDAEISIGNHIRRIIKKCKHHELNWTLTKHRVNSKLIITKGELNVKKN